MTLPSVKKAKKKQMTVVKPSDLGVNLSPRLKTAKVSEPTRRGVGVKVPDVATLVGYGHQLLPATSHGKNVPHEWRPRST